MNTYITAVIVSSLATGALASSTPVPRPEPMQNCVSISMNYNFHWTLEADRLNMMTESHAGFDTWVAFGVGGQPTFNRMVGGDAQITFMSSGGDAVAEDYYMEGPTVCDGSGRGVCRDSSPGNNGSNNNFGVQGFRVSGNSYVVFARSLVGGDPVEDIDIPLADNTNFLFAIGKLRTADNVPLLPSAMIQKSISLARPPQMECMPFARLGAAPAQSASTGISAGTKALIVFLVALVFGACAAGEFIRRRRNAKFGGPSAVVSSAPVPAPHHTPAAGPPQFNGPGAAYPQLQPAYPQHQPAYPQNAPGDV